MNIEVWSDVVCPWCYIGKRRLESAVKLFQHGDEISVSWRSFELDPESPRRAPVPLDEMLAQKYGMSREEARAANTQVTSLAAAEGLEYHLEHQHSGNSFDAHRLIHLAAEKGLPGAMKERLMRAHFSESAAIGEPDVLVRLACEVGIDEEEAKALLESDRFADEVRADEAEAGTIGVRGVPFFLIERKWALSGAQPTDLFLKAIEQVWSELHEAPEPAQ